jgi:hypothetical protein
LDDRFFAKVDLTLILADRLTKIVGHAPRLLRNYQYGVAGQAAYERRVRD